MKPFKVGDRVRVYYSGHTVTAGRVHSICAAGQKYGSLPVAGALQVEDANSGQFYWVHPKQCRRLVKRKRCCENGFFGKAHECRKGHSQSENDIRKLETVPGDISTRKHWNQGERDVIDRINFLLACERERRGK